jgi:pyridoxamine 5'-phosphate oxidase
VNEAVDLGLPEANAMVLATVDADGRPSTRTVLLRHVDQRGIVFFTNYESRKGRDIATNPWVSITFVWPSMQRQIHVAGTARRISRGETVEYFSSRPRSSQIAAWASPQSQVLRDRRELDARVREIEDRFDGLEIPPPKNWGGIRVSARTFEFWQGRQSRLHDRFRYARRASSWSVERLAP